MINYKAINLLYLERSMCMLEYLHIKNVALIDEQTINFNEGLNILTGETGAGKSMIIDSINFVLGEKVSKDFIRNGQESALVEILFFLKDNKVIEAIKDMDIELDAYNSLIISRELNKSGRTVCKINGRVSTISMVKEISSLLIDIHGQHQHQSLLNPSKHIVLLDQFCTEEFFKLRHKLYEQYHEYKNIQNSINQLIGDESQRQQKIDILQYQVNEIEAANLKVDEEENLLQQRKILASTEKLSKGLEEINILLNGDEFNSDGVISQIGRIGTLLKDLSSIDSSLDEVSKLADTVELQLDEMLLEIRHYNKEIDHNPESLYEIETRLDLIYNLKKKYGSNIKEILDYYTKTKNQLDFILNSEEQLKKLNKDLKSKEKNIIELCQKISDARKSKAEEVQKQIEDTLIDLEMKSAKFKIQIDKRENFTDNGWDKVEFLISANRGETLKPLSKIASGGEMSRVMLAIKTVLADIDNIETLIFDEIDTGVSGRTAQKVAEKMKYISNNHQILCITHLPQIAAMADSHYLIEKKEQNSRTVTQVFDLTMEQSILELARLIGGATITNATITAAKEMKELAKS